MSALVADVSHEVLGSPIAYSEEALATILSARHFVDVRTTPGGPAPEPTAAAITAARQALQSDETWAKAATDALAAAERKLSERSAML